MEYIASSFNRIFKIDEGESSDLIGHEESIFESQKYGWDCGLACCVMVLRWLKIDSSKLYSSKQAVRCSPLWSIELFCLLKGFNVDCELFATSISVEDHHMKLDWYKTFLESDKEAITEAIEICNDDNWNSNVHLRKLTMEELKASLLTSSHSDKCPACGIILVHSPALTYTDVSQCVESDSFVGHFIFLLSFDEVSDEFSYFNPATSHSVVCRVSSDVLSFAWSYVGSDNDIILCRRSNIEHT